MRHRFAKKNNALRLVEIVYYKVLKPGEIEIATGKQPINLNDALRIKRLECNTRHERMILQNI